MTHSQTYAAAGVDIAAARQAKDLMAAAVRSTYGPEVLAGHGAFGGLYDAAGLRAMASPVLVASTDSVGTKMMVAARMGRWDTVGQDLVNHCVNDILVQGARPIFFLDYVATTHIDPEQIAALVGGVAAACRAVGCALLGGETASTSRARLTWSALSSGWWNARAFSTGRASGRAMPCSACLRLACTPTVSRWPAACWPTWTGPRRCPSWVPRRTRRSWPFTAPI
jgi:hypothetical protein